MNWYQKMNHLKKYSHQILMMTKMERKQLQRELIHKTHISALPAELLMYIFKWVVSQRLDLRSLERIAQVCKGFYALARDAEIWRLACIRIWGVNLGSTVSWNGSWREMYLKRAHVIVTVRAIYYTG